MKTKKITGKTKFDKIMEINPDAGMILFEHGLHCVGCGMASVETLEQGCIAHGMGKKEIKELIDKLNKKKKNKTVNEKKPIKKIYLKIWKLAKPYYEKGRPMDIDHIKWMIQDALIVCQKEKIDDSLLLPLVILHDVGYGVGEKVYFNKDLKHKHMKIGAKIAKKILKKVKYPKEKIKKIVYYISVHDNWIFGDNEIYKKDIILGTFTDLDYIWMATPKGFPIFMKILNKNSKEMLEYLWTNEKLKNRSFVTKTTKKIYNNYVRDRKEEMKK